MLYLWAFSCGYLVSGLHPCTVGMWALQITHPGFGPQDPLRLRKLRSE